MRELRAPAVVLAAGGFQGDAEMRTRYLGPGWELAKVRGTRFNTGDGIRMALDAGAAPKVVLAATHERALQYVLLADLKRHDIGPNFWERNFDGTVYLIFQPAEEGPPAGEEGGASKNIASKDIIRHSEAHPQKDIGQVMAQAKAKKNGVVAKKLVGMADVVIAAAQRAKDPTFEIPMRALSNVSFNLTGPGNYSVSRTYPIQTRSAWMPNDPWRHTP